MMMRPDRCSAARRTTPSAGLPAARRRSGVSRPWSMALRIMWVSGSASARSPSCRPRCASPSVTRRTCLPVRSATSRTRRGMRWNTDFTGWARIAITLSWISRVSCSRSSSPIATPEARDSPASMHPLRQHGLVDDQLADEVDQAVDAVEIDADGRAALVGLGVIGFGRVRPGRVRPRCVWPAGGLGARGLPLLRARLPAPPPRASPCATRASSASTLACMCPISAAISKSPAAAFSPEPGSAPAAAIDSSQSPSTNSNTSRIAALALVGASAETIQVR